MSVTVSIFGAIVYVTSRSASAASVSVTLLVVEPSAPKVASYATGREASSATASSAVSASVSVSGLVTAKLSSSSDAVSSLSSKSSVIVRVPVNAAVATGADGSKAMRSVSVAGRWFPLVSGTVPGEKTYTPPSGLSSGWWNVDK